MKNSISFLFKYEISKQYLLNLNVCNAIFFNFHTLFLLKKKFFFFRKSLKIQKKIERNLRLRFFSEKKNE